MTIFKWVIDQANPMKIGRRWAESSIPIKVESTSILQVQVEHSPYSGRIDSRFRSSWHESCTGRRPILVKFSNCQDVFTSNICFCSSEKIKFLLVTRNLPYLMNMVTKKKSSYRNIRQDFPVFAYCMYPTHGLHSSQLFNGEDRAVSIRKQHNQSECSSNFSLRWDVLV